MKKLSDGAAEVRLGLSDTRYVRDLVVRLGVSFKNAIRLLDEAEALDQLSRELHIRVSEIVASLDGKFQLPYLRHIIYHHHLGPVPHVDTLLQGKTISGL
jgi:GTP1/Obg family GTP-binding protein